MEKIVGRSLEELRVPPGRRLAVVDFVGVKARASDKRYVARSYPAPSMERMIDELQLGRPLLTSMRISTDIWFKPPAAKTGFIEQVAGGTGGSVLGGVLGWDPAREQLKILTPWPEWDNMESRP